MTDLPAVLLEAVHTLCTRWLPTCAGDGEGA